MSTDAATLDGLDIDEIINTKEGDDSSDSGGKAGIPLVTAQGRDWPSVRQFSVFLENKVGMLMDLVRRFETSDNRIVALTVLDSADCAIIRLVLSDPERGREILEQAELPFVETDLLVVQLPEDAAQPMAQICKALLQAEISIHYVYPLMLSPRGHPALAIYVENHEMAAITLQRRGFTIFTEKDLET